MVTASRLLSISFRTPYQKSESVIESRKDRYINRVSVCEARARGHRILLLPPTQGEVTLLSGWVSG